MTGYHRIFVDTWGWLALGHHRDQSHQRVLEIYQQLLSSQVQIHTSDYVLDEVVTLVFKREHFQEAVQFMEGIFASAEVGQLHIDCVTYDVFQAAWSLRKQYQDKPLVSFTDLTSMAIMKQHSIQHVLTGDDHFAQVGMGFVKIP
jgi:uncharacterized protein